MFRVRYTFTPPDMAVGHRLGQALPGEILGAPPGIIVSEPQVDRPRPALDRGGDRLPGARGDSSSIISIYFLPLLRRKISRLASLRSALIWAASSRASLS